MSAGAFVGYILVVGLAMWGALDLIARALDWLFDIEETLQ